MNLRVGLVLAVWALLLGLVAMPGSTVAAQGQAQQSAAERCFEHHQFGAQPVDVAKSADGQTVLAQVSWGYHEAIGCYLVLDGEALAALQAAPAPQSLPSAATDASMRCFEHHKFGERPVDVAKSADRQTVLARLSWGYHEAIGCYLALDDEALAALRGAAQPDPSPGPASAAATLVSSDAGICALRSDQTMACWVSARHEEVPVPGGQFESIKSVDPALCGLRADQTVVCWEWESDWSQRDEDGNPGLVLVEANLPDWRFTDIALAGRVSGQNYACGLRGDLVVACWEWETKYDSEYDDYRAFAVELELLEGQFTDIRGRWGTYVCGLRVDQTVACWGWQYRFDSEGDRVAVELVESDAPAGRFTGIEGQRGGQGDRVCGLRVDQTIACWEWEHERDGDGKLVFRFVELGVPAGRFTGIDGFSSWCGLRVDQTIACWGWQDQRDGDGNWVQVLEELDLPERQLTDVKVVATSSGFDRFWCGLRADLIVACWDWSGEDLDLVERSLPDGQFTHVEHVGGRYPQESWCGLQSGLITVCWSWSSERDDDGNYRQVLEGADLPSGHFTDVFRTYFHSFWCGLRDDQTVACWPQPDVPADWMDEGLSDGQIIAIEYRLIGEGLEDWCVLRKDDEFICASAQDLGGYG